MMLRLPTLFLLLIFSSSSSSSFAQTNTSSCSSYKFPANQHFTACNDLPTLNSFLHWNYDSSSNKLQIAYRHAGLTSSKWVAWAINPTSSGMLGSQALVAFQQSDGSMRVYTSPISSYQTSLQQGNLSFVVSDLSATFSNGEITIFANLGLNFSNINITSLNHLWQDGPVSENTPHMHSLSGDNMRSVGTVNLLSGEIKTVSAGNGKNRMRNVHGVLNAVSWGIMMPAGALTARYLKVFKSAGPTWFYLHVSCQSLSYLVGVGGGITGLVLGGKSAGVRYDVHRTIGIVMFCLGTLQVFALGFRPKPDHKYRIYWNIYHHLSGYSVIVLSIINVFEGFKILSPDQKWKDAYIGIIVALGFCAICLEAYTWFVVLLRRRRLESCDIKVEQSINGANGV